MAQYNSSSGRTAEERIKPGLSHSRYVHLKLLLRNIEQIVEDYIKKVPDQVLGDIGCGEVPYKPMIAPYVKDYIGIDLPGNPKAQSFVDLATNRCDLPDDHCDIVWSVQVLEHVADPQRYLQECRRILKPGGKLILCTHGHWMYHPDPIDFWRWTCEGLKKTVEEQGFIVQRQWGMMNLMSMGIQLFQDAGLRLLPLPNFMRKPFQFVMQRCIGLSEKIVSRSKTARAYTDKDACVFFIVATK